jgi:sugar lactone lactonase YvrE
MAIVSDTLFVTDIDCIRRFHRETGAPLRDLCMDGVSFLNDLAANSRGDLYFSDTGADEVSGAVYLLRQLAEVPQIVALADGTVLSGAGLGGPNGLHVDGDGLVVATVRSGELFRVTTGGERIQLLPPSEMGLDGIVSLGERGILVSSWGDSAIYWIRTDGTVRTVMQEVEAPADIGYDSSRSRILVPLFLSDELSILEVR